MFTAPPVAMPDILLNVMSWLCRTLFSGTHKLFMASQETLALITYCVLDHFYLMSHRARFGENIQTNQRRDHRPVVLTIRARLAYKGAPCAQRHLWDEDNIFAAATQGINRNTFINDVESELQRRISDNTYQLDVDVVYEWLHSSMRKAAEKHFTRSTQKRGRNHEYEAAAAHRAQCRRDLRTLCYLHPQAWQVRCARARAAEADHHVRSIKRAQRKNLEHARLIELQEDWERRDFATTWKLTRIPKETPWPLHRLHHFVSRNGWHILQDQAVKEAALLHLWTYLKQNMYQQQTTLTQHIGHESSNHVFGNVWQEDPFAKFTQRGLFLAHYGDCWSIQMRSEANNVTASASNNVRRKIRCVSTKFFVLWSGTCLFHEEHLEVGTCLKVSLCPRTTRSQAFLDYGWCTPSIQQGKRTLHSSGNWIPTVGNETTQQVIAIADAENEAIAQHSVLRERYRAAKKNLTAVLYNLTNAFACGAQESQAGEPASLADVVRAEVQNITARKHLCQRLAGAQLRLDCADGQLAAKIGSGTLPGDTVAGGWFLLHFPPKT